MEVNLEGGGMELVLLVRCGGGDLVAKHKMRKGSVMSRSGVSSNASWEHSDMIHTEVTLRQDEFTYQLSHNVSYTR